MFSSFSQYFAIRGKDSRTRTISFRRKRPYNLPMKPRDAHTRRMTRRQLTALLGVSPLLAQVESKVPPKGVPVVPPAPTPEARMEKANAAVHAISDRLSKIDVPIALEPAFAFKP